MSWPSSPPWLSRISSRGCPRLAQHPDDVKDSCRNAALISRRLRRGYLFVSAARTGGRGGFIWRKRSPSRGRLSMLLRLVLVIAIVAALTAAGYAHVSGKRRKPVEGISSGEVGVRLDAFWSWWRMAAPRLAATIDASQADSIAGELSAKVHAIDPRLAWETGPGLKGAHH